MKATVVPIDSEVAGGPVVSIEDFDPAQDFAAFEAKLIAEHNPIYAACKVPVERVMDAHVLEAAGFRLVECQIRTRIQLRQRWPEVRPPYRFERVTTEEALAQVMEIGTATFKHDRFTTDPAVPRGLSARRYRRYLQHSFRAADEAVYRLFDPTSGRTVAFKSHRYQPNGQALLLLGGVHPDLQRLGLGVLNTYGELNVLIDRGCTSALTHIAASNYPVFNMEIGKLGFKAITTFATFRRLYRPFPESDRARSVR